MTLAQRHRVQGLVHHALSAAEVVVSSPAGPALRDEAQAIATRNLQLAAESVRLVRRFEAASVPVMVIKGTVLATLAYGTLAIKMSWDVDLLVPPERLEDAAEVLRDAGYRCVLPGPDPADLLPIPRNRFGSAQVCMSNCTML